jgi:salicylate hydroxylase
MDTPIAIIGGGIAGLSAAIALARKGHSVVVAEQRINGSETGAGLQLSPNASHILLKWGLSSGLAQSAVAPKGLSIRRWAEPRSYAQMPMKSQTDGAPFWVMLRAELHQTLRSAAIRNPLITVREGWELTKLQHQEPLSKLTFDASGESITITAQCVIGADGQHSATRRFLGDARDLDHSGWEAWRTLIPASETLDFIRDETTNLWLGRDCHAVHYPVSARKLINLVVIRKAASTHAGWGQQGDPSNLDDIKALAAPTLRDLMTSAPQWSVWSLKDRTVSPYLAKGTAALTGDAAHPILPFLAQGAAMAIEDAAVLAHCLPSPQAFEKDSIAKGLKNYAAQRASRVHKVYKAARSNAFAYHLPPTLAWFRDRRLASMGPDGMQHRYEWLYGWRSPE